MIPTDDVTGLSRLYHLNSEPWLDESGIPFVNHADCGHSVESDFRVSLPDPESSTISDLIRSRKSVREFRDATMSQSQLSALLAAAYGKVDVGSQNEDQQERSMRRSVPSGGATYPLEIYLFLQKIDQLDDGLYHYDATSHELEHISERNREAELQDAFISYPFMKNANVVLCHVAVFMRSQKKYGARGYRYILLEAGHSAQNVCLAATELKLGSLCMGGFWDHKLNKLLGLDCSQAGAVYSVAIGFN